MIGRSADHPVLAKSTVAQSTAKAILNLCIDVAPFVCILTLNCLPHTHTPALRPGAGRGSQFADTPREPDFGSAKIRPVLQMPAHQASPSRPPARRFRDRGVPKQRNMDIDLKLRYTQASKQIIQQQTGWPKSIWVIPGKGSRWPTDPSRQIASGKFASTRRN